MVRETAVVPAGLADSRAFAVAFELLDSVASKAAARKCAKRGELLVDGEPCRYGDRLQPGATLTVLERPPRPGQTVYPRTLDVAWADEHMAIVDKPAGLTTSGYRPRTLENALPHNFERSVEFDALPWPRPVHRLDARTSGLVVIARTARALVGLGRSFQERGVRKRYRAIVGGRLDGAGEIREPIGGREAHTTWRAVEHTRSLKKQWTTVVELSPHTGRTHQLRIHMAQLGHPILGDGRYGDDFKGKGLYLQAYGLLLPHPIRNEPLDIEIPELPRFRSYREREARRWLKHHPLGS